MTYSPLRRCKHLMMVVGVTAGLSAVSTGANAALFDFAALAQGNERLWNTGAGIGDAAGTVFNDLTDEWTVGGIGVVATASNDGGGGFTGTSLAYLDSGNAGLGVCSISNCAGSSDDNTGIVGDGAGGATALESLSLKFSTVVEVFGLLFRNRNHGLLNGSLSINGVTKTVTNGQVDGGVGFLAQGDTFDFARIAGGSSINRDFYIDTVGANVGQLVPEVPLPAALPLFLTGLGFMGLAGWRRKRKAAPSAA